MRTAEPVPRRNKVQFAGQTDFKIIDEAGNTVNIGKEDTFKVPDPDNRHGDTIDWQQVKQKELDGTPDGDEVADWYHPHQQDAPDQQNPTRPVQDDRTHPFESPDGNPRPSEPDGSPRRIDQKNWKPESLDGTDETGLDLPEKDRKKLKDHMRLLSENEIKQLKNGKLGRLPTKASFPKIVSASDASTHLRIVILV